MSISKTSFCALAIWLICHCSIYSQTNFVEFSTIPKSGTDLIYAHHDDDLIWMLPFWSITDKFISGVMPSTPTYETIIHQQQLFLNNNESHINYESNWITPWGSITQDEYEQYYWGNYPSLSYLADDHLISKWNNSDIILVRKEINRIKAKLEQYIASPDVARLITHNNWGEYGHQHHKALNTAVRELAVKYRKDVWMSEFYLYENVPSGIPSDIKYTSASFDTNLYTGIRSIYEANGCWTWDPTVVPSREYKIIKIVEGGVDKSDILTGQTVTTSGPSQNAPGAYIFDGVDDYMTLPGNNSPSFTIAMAVRPDQIRRMDISKMAEYPSSTVFDRSFYMQTDGRITAHVYNGGSKSVTSTSPLNAGEWTNILMTGDADSMKLYINGVPDASVITGSTFTFFNSPEFVLGQTQETTNFFNGQIKDIQFFDYVLSDEEIASLTGTSSQETYVITANSGIGGTVNPSGTRIVVKGEARTYNITPDTGYDIDDVKVDNNSVGPVATYVFNNITSNHPISATFTPVAFTIKSDAGLNGSISPDGDITTSYGTIRSFSIIPDQGYQVSDVEVDNTSVGAVSEYTFENVLANHTIAASFETAKYTINGSAMPNGSITPSGIITLDHGTNQTYLINANSGFMISDVRVDDISVGAVPLYSFTNVSDNHTISATFEDITYTITGSSGPNGSITPGGAITVNYGSNKTYTITPNTGYNISDVLIDNVSAGIISSYTFNDVTADHTISATFSPITFTITSNSGDNGSITPSRIITANYGTNKIYTIKANAGYHISDVMVDNISFGAVSTYKFSNIRANHTISATFAINTYTITGSSGKNGSITPAGITTLDFGTNRVYTFTPDPGFQISDVLVDNNSMGPLSTYVFSSVSANHTISVIFSIITHKITASAGPNGSITPTGEVVLDRWMSGTYTIIPATGFRLSDLKVDNVSVDPVLTYTFNNVTSNHTISANFSLITYTITGNVVKGTGEGGGGSVNPSGQLKVNYGSHQTCTITPATGYVISDVIVDNISMGVLSTYTFGNITTDHTISAIFKPIIHIIKSNAGPGGSVLTQGTETVIYATDQTYTITPDAGYEISEVLVDGTSVGTPLSYLFSNITTNHTISATFNRIVYLITESAYTGGSISPATTPGLYYGENQTYYIIPENTYKILDVKIDNISQGPLTSYTFKNITASHTISASFKLIDTYLIKANTGPGGTISPAGPNKFPEGTNQTYTITPDIGYRITGVQVDNISEGILSDYTFSNLISDHSISATFTMDIEVKIYPNPFKDYFKINILSPSDYRFNISIINITGEVVFTRTNIPGNAETEINLRNTPAGIYFLRLYSFKKRIVYRIVKY